MHQLKKNLNRFDLILYMVLFLGVLAPLLFTGWQMGLFRKPIGVDAAPLVRSNSHVLRVAVAGDFAPHSFVNKEGQLSGMDVEILYHLANRMQRKLELFTGDWPTCRKMMQEGEVDVLSGLEIYSNMPDVIKTIPTSADTMQVFGKKPVNHVSQLSGKRVAIMKNSVLMTSYDFNCTYVEYPTNTSILAAVEGGDVDYGISHGAVAQDIIQKNHFNIKPGLMLLGSYPAFGISKDQIGLRDEINNYLRQMSHDGTLKNLQEKWMEDYAMDRSLPAVYHRYHIFYIAYTIAFLVFAGVLYLYRKYVRRQSAYIDALLAYQNKLKSLVEDQFSHQDSSLSP
ncbi:MAG: transporter substrate-binding domain-containing protein, partial [Dialister sp.]|nr:transporter substrate-binding domain-containing protein [Dialister sp.]MDY5378293.1 transporter substrate-binding domain-containing protein [Dialister sp.]